MGKRIPALFSAIVLACAVLTGCGGSANDNSGGNTTISDAEEANNSAEEQFLGVYRAVGAADNEELNEAIIALGEKGVEPRLFINDDGTIISEDPNGTISGTWEPVSDTEIQFTLEGDSAHYHMRIDTLFIQVWADEDPTCILYEFDD